MKRVWMIFLAAVQEIFDEAAYARFLGQDGQVTRQSYAAFLKDREQKIGARVKCC